MAVSLVALAVAGCKGEPEKAAQPQPVANTQETAAPEGSKSLPTVTLTGAKVEAGPDKASTRISITASGPFGSNVVPKSDPERILVVLHNAKAGDVPKNIEINDGTVSGVEVAQLDTGKGPAVRITISLARKTAHRVIPGESALMIDVKKAK